MNHKNQQLKQLIIEEMLNLLKEDVNYNFNFNGKKMKVRFDVNSNPTKKGIKIQFTPLEQNPGMDSKQLMSSLQIHLNQKLGAMGMNVDFDPDVPYDNVIGFTLKLDAVSSVIMKALGGGQQLPDTKVHKSSDLGVGQNNGVQGQSGMSKQQNPFKGEEKPTA